MCLDLTYITVLLQQGFGLSPDKTLHVSYVCTVTSKSVRKWTTHALEDRSYSYMFNCLHPS